MRLRFCAACGATAGLEHHHVVPRVKGGGDDPANLMTLCRSCHQAMHHRGPYDHAELVRLGRARAQQPPRIRLWVALLALLGAAFVGMAFHLGPVGLGWLFGIVLGWVALCHRYPVLGRLTVVVALGLIVGGLTGRRYR